MFTTTTPANKKDAECFNCKRKGHCKSECWRKGGGKEGQRPKKDKDKDKDKVNASEAEASSGDESWVVIVEVDNASSQAPSDMQSAPEICSSLTKNRSEAELYDSGTTCHISPFQHCFTNLRAIPPQPITAANKGIFYASGIGDLKIDVPNGTEVSPITLKDVLYAPDISMTVISICKIEDVGYSVAIKDKICKIKNQKSSKMIGRIP